MSATNWYITQDDTGSEFLCVLDENGDLYTGTVKVFYSHGSVVDTAVDANEPTIPARYHMALVYGALWLMGFPQYKALFDDYILRAQHKVNRTGPNPIWPPFY